MLHFQVGDKAVYPAQGVTEVTNIEQKEVGGKVSRFYCLRVLTSGATVLVPIDKAEQIGLRDVVNAEQVQEVYGILQGAGEPKVDRENWSRRHRALKEKLFAGSIFDVAEVYRDLERLRISRKLSASERQFLDTAKTLIVQELSVASGTSQEKVEREMSRRTA